MLNIIWPILIFLSFLFSIFTGKINELNLAIFSSASEAIQITLTLFGSICLWSGLLKIVQETTMIDHINKIWNPIMKVLFPTISKEEKVYHEITMNLSANMLGLGNAATPLGLRAMDTLQQKNKQKEILSDEMMMFILLNTTSLQLIPTTILAIRASLGSQNPTNIMVPIWIVTAITNITGVILIKLFLKNKRRKI